MKKYSHSILPLLLVACFFSACKVGETARKINIAQKPDGENTSFYLNNNEVTVAELLSFQEDSFIILHNSFVKQIPVSMVEKVRFIGRGLNYDRNNEYNHLTRNNQSYTKTLKDFRIHSRYPQKINEELMKILLEAYNQDEIIKVE